MFEGLKADMRRAGLDPILVVEEVFGALAVLGIPVLLLFICA